MGGCVLKAPDDGGWCPYVERMGVRARVKVVVQGLVSGVSLSLYLPLCVVLSVVGKGWTRLIARMTAKISQRGSRKSLSRKCVVLLGSWNRGLFLVSSIFLTFSLSPSFFSVIELDLSVVGKGADQVKIPKTE